MKECDLYPPVRDWLLANGWELHVEIFDADIVAVKDGKILAVELKPYLTAELISQLRRRGNWADLVMAAIASNPSSTQQLRDEGFGLLIVKNGKVRRRIGPRQQPLYWHRRRAYRVKQLTGRSPAQAHELAGLPSCGALRRQREARIEHRQQTAGADAGKVKTTEGMVDNQCQSKP